MAFQAYVGSFLQTGAASTTQAITGLGFRPTAILFFAVPEADPTVEAFADGNQLSLGFVDALGLGTEAAAHAFDNEVAQDTYGAINTGEPITGAYNDGVLTPKRLEGHIDRKSVV